VGIDARDQRGQELGGGKGAQGDWRKRAKEIVEEGRALRVDAPSVQSGNVGYEQPRQRFHRRQAYSLGVSPGVTLTIGAAHDTMDPQHMKCMSTQVKVVVVVLDPR
jgi:hypothetical protein